MLHKDTYGLHECTYCTVRVPCRNQGLIATYINFISQIDPRHLSCALPNTLVCSVPKAYEKSKNYRYAISKIYEVCVCVHII